MRIILYTGKGGVGKTSIAAATAVKSAQSGKKTLVVSTDPAHSLGDSFDRELSPEPVEIMEFLWAQEIDTIHEVEKGWGEIQKYLTLLLTSKTLKDITTEELTIFPGMEELLSLIRILGYYRKKAYDVIIIDCAPTGETLALLSYPDMLSWWMNKLFPLKRAAVKIMKPVAQPLLGIPFPSDNVMGEVENIFAQLSEMKKIFSDRETTSIRIVVNPEKMVIKEAQRSFTYLNIYDFGIDAIMVNKVIPDNVSDSYFDVWKNTQKNYMAMIAESFAPLPVYCAPLFEQEVVGLDMLSRMGEEIFHAEDPNEIKYSMRTQQVSKDGDTYKMLINMPFTEKKNLSLSRKGDELIIKAGSIKRNIVLPRTLLGLSVSKAEFEDERLKIIFAGGDKDV